MASISFILFSAAFVFAASSEPLTAQDWPNLSEQRKIYYLFAKRESPEYEGVLFTHSVADYIQIIDQKISKSPALKDEDMDEVFRSVVYENESGSRDVLTKSPVKAE